MFWKKIWQTVLTSKIRPSPGPAGRPVLTALFISAWYFLEMQGLIVTSWKALIYDCLVLRDLGRGNILRACHTILNRHNSTDSASLVDSQMIISTIARTLARNKTE